MPKITLTEAKKRLSQLSGWQLGSRAITKQFEFKNFKQAFEFMSRCAVIAEEMQHHPEWSNTYNKVSVCLTTHSEKGLSELDFELARHMDEIQRSISDKSYR